MCNPQPTIEEVLNLAAKIEKMPGRSSTAANIVRAYRDLTGASLEESINWMNKAH